MCPDLFLSSGRAAGPLHGLALRATIRYAVDDAAWVTTIVAVLLALVMATVPCA